MMNESREKNTLNVMRGVKKKKIEFVGWLQASEDTTTRRQSQVRSRKVVLMI